MRISISRGIGRRASHAPGCLAAGACLTVLLAHGARAAAVLSVQAPAGEFASTDARWQPWLGCWELSHEMLDDPEQRRPTDVPLTRSVPDPSTAIRVCVTPEGATSGVRMSTEVDGRPVIEERLVADGTEQPVDEANCRGSRRAEWSEDGLRLFSRAEITCAGEPAQSVSHLATIVSGTWVDVQAITREARQGVRVRRYRRIGNARPDPENRAIAGTGSFDVADVKEASAKVTPLVLQAALVETAARFRLTGRTMIELDRAGVADEVTDVMVALTYPDRFTVARERAPGGSDIFPPGSFADIGEDDEAYLWGYAPFAYSRWGFNDYWYTPDIVIVDESPEGGNGGHPASSGRVVNGHGYTRIDRADADAGARGSDSTDSTTSTSTAPAAESGGVSSQGYSSGDSSGGSDRTAQPRPPR
jgi:hypothetical protein